MISFFIGCFLSLGAQRYYKKMKQPNLATDILFFRKNGQKFFAKQRVKHGPNAVSRTIPSCFRLNAVPMLLQSGPCCGATAAVLLANGTFVPAQRGLRCQLTGAPLQDASCARFSQPFGNQMVVKIFQNSKI